MASTSKMDICNLALSNFGGGKITSFDDGKEQSRLCDLYYTNALETTLEDFPWNFAQRIEYLALSTKTFPGWDYAYLYPANCVKIWKVFDESGEHTDINNECNIYSDGTNKYFVCNIENAYCRFSAKINDSSLYTPTFIEALSFLLSAKIVNQLSGNAQKATEMMQKYQIAINRAMLSNAAERNVKPLMSKRYVTVRS